MAWLLPIAEGDDWQTVDFYNQCVSVCNGARAFYNDMRTAITGSTVSIAALSTLATNADLQDGQAWYDLQERVNDMLAYAYHYADVSNGNAWEDFAYFRSATSWELLIEKANDVLTTAGVNSADHFAASPTFGSGGVIPFRRTYQLSPGGAIQTAYGYVEDGDRLNHTYMLNQLYACCVLIQDLTLGGAKEQVFESFIDIRDRADNASYTDNASLEYVDGTGADCAGSRSNVQNNYNTANPLFNLSGGVPFAHVFRDDNTTHIAWWILRGKAKAQFSDMENGDLKTFFYVNTSGYQGAANQAFLDIDGQGYTQGKIYEVVETLGSTAATVTTAKMGDFTAEPINANSGTMNCAATTDQKWSYRMWGGFVLKTSVSDPT